AGIGGAGMSAYALVAHAWGADVAGWDRVDTPYLAHLSGIDVAVSPDPPEPPNGWEVFVSTAFAGPLEGRPRADLLAELVAQRRTIVVAGAHGKTTTSAMIAFSLDRLGLEPAFLIGGDVPQLGGNARAGSGWLIVEGDESDRSVAALRPEIAVLLNVDLDHHTTFATRVELEAFFEDWLQAVPHVVRAEELEPVALELAVPGEHNRRNAAAALAALELAGVSEIYPAGKQPLPGVSGRLIVDELARVRPGMRIGWAPALDDAARIVAAWARPGDTVLTLGAGDVDRAAALVLEALA